MSTQDFINETLPYAQRGKAATGVLVSVILAQWACETGWGSSDYFSQGHNPAGISPGGVVAAYPSLDAGELAWEQTMELSYYDGVRGALGWNAQCVALGESPWAGSHYDNGNGPGSILLDLVKENALWTYDAPAPGPGPQPQPQPSGGTVSVELPILQSGSSGDSVKSVQAVLNAKGGSGLTVDGQFGPATQAAVRNLQAFLQIEVDGIVGQDTWSVLLVL